jgi:hypothetical protein
LLPRVDLVGLVIRTEGRDGGLLLGGNLFAHRRVERQARVGLHFFVDASEYPVP